MIIFSFLYSLFTVFRILKSVVPKAKERRKPYPRKYRNIPIPQNQLSYNMQETIFNTVKHMCWTICNEFIILYNPKTIQPYMLNKSIMHHYENFHAIILRFAEVVISRTYATQPRLSLSDICMKLTTNI